MNVQKDRDNPNDSGERRRRAEEVLCGRGSDADNLSAEEVRHLIHELEVHQIELEMQNEELHRAEEALEAARDKYADLYDFAPIGYLTVSENGLIMEANLAAARLLGTEINVLVGQSLSRFIATEEQEVYYKHHRGVFAANHQQTCETTMVTRDGTPVDVQMQSVGIPTNDGAVTKWRTVISDVTERKRVEDALQQTYHDLERRVEERTAELVATNRGLQQQITARKRAETALRASEQRYAKAAEIAHFGYWDRDFSKNVIIWSNEVYRIFGVAPGHFDGTYESFLCLVHPDDRKRLKRAENTAISAAEQLDIEYRIVRPDGTERVIHAVAQARFDETGKPLGLHGVVHDITQRKLAEEQAREHQAQLAHVARFSTMGEMATGIAHEINQPLAAMVTFTQACLRFMDSGTADFDKLRDVMQEVATQGLRAGEIIKRLRGFTRMKETKGMPADLNRLIHEAVRFVEAEARDKSIIVVLDLADALPEVVVDAIQIEQVILNLLRNGIDAMTMANRAADAVLTVKTKVGGAGTVQLSVSDTGSGLSEEIVGRVFDPFFTTKPQGMGMGLSISRSIIEAHKGHLWADDLRRDGTTFHFTLPSTNRENSVEH